MFWNTIHLQSCGKWRKVWVSEVLRHVAQNQQKWAKLFFGVWVLVSVCRRLPTVASCPGESEPETARWCLTLRFRVVTAGASLDVGLWVCPVFILLPRSTCHPTLRKERQEDPEFRVSLCLWNTVQGSITTTKQFRWWPLWHTPWVPALGEADKQLSMSLRIAWFT